MSRSYEMQLEIRQFNMSSLAQIREACAAEWPFDDLEVQDVGTDPVLIGSAISNLCGGESEDEFAERLTQAVWRANGGFCQVTVRALYMDDLPYAVYEADEDDYQEWRKTAA